MNTLGESIGIMVVALAAIALIEFILLLKLWGIGSSLSSIKRMVKQAIQHKSDAAESMQQFALEANLGNVDAAREILNTKLEETLKAVIAKIGTSTDLDNERHRRHIDRLEADWQAIISKYSSRYYIIGENVPMKYRNFTIANYLVTLSRL